MVSHATSADDATALAHLPSAQVNPVNQNSDVLLTGPLARALGFNKKPTSRPYDSIIYLDTGDMNLTRPDADPNKYDIVSTVEHEMDEVLGMGSNLDDVAGGGSVLSDPVYPQDLFRYDAGGNRSYTTNINAVSYFSLDGTTHLAQFNQDSSGDFGDWYSINGDQVPQVQDAFGTPGVALDLGTEKRA